jgi:hypothetical protein
MHTSSLLLYHHIVAIAVACAVFWSGSATAQDSRPDLTVRLGARDSAAPGDNIGPSLRLTVRNGGTETAPGKIGTLIPILTDYDSLGIPKSPAR